MQNICQAAHKIGIASDMSTSAGCRSILLASLDMAHMCTGTGLGSKQAALLCQAAIQVAALNQGRIPWWNARDISGWSNFLRWLGT